MKYLVWNFLLLLYNRGEVLIDLNNPYNQLYSTVTDLTKTTTIPYLTFIYRYRTHEFGYVKELTDSSHLKLHNTISKLKHQGLGYRKISKKLNEMGIKSLTGKTFYPSLVSNMWRTIKRREEKLNREVISEYTDFDIVFYNF